MPQTPAFVPLSVATLPQRLGSLEPLTIRVGDDPASWTVAEIGDGNLNLVFIVSGARGSVIVKQALPYVRLVGESWPLPLKRSYFEYNALQRHETYAPGMTPEVYHFDRDQALIIMRYLSPHIIMRKGLIEGRQFPRAGRDLGLFLANTLFLSSDLHLDARQRKLDAALFADNSELCEITENLVFSDPYFDAPLNRHTSPQLDALVGELRADSALKVEVQRLKHHFVTRAEAMLHGDLHTGSIMVTEDETFVIDPEFAFYGPMAFDVGMLLANIWMAYFAQAGHEQMHDRQLMRSFLLATGCDIWETFAARFSELWRTQRHGILYQRTLFEDKGDLAGSEAALSGFLTELWTDALGFAGIEIHRRILGLAHNADFETIADEDRRAECEAKALKFGRELIRARATLPDVEAVNALARTMDGNPT